MLAGKVIVVMGGTSGIGLAAARAIADAGARLVVVGLNETDTADAADQLGNSALVRTADATDPATATDAVALAVAQWGGLDGLYHVAGGSARAQGDGPLDELTDAGWDRALRLNLTSVMYSNRAAVKWWMRQRRGGSIVNVASVLGFSPSPRHFATHGYAAAKAGIVGLSRACAARYTASNIRCNVLAPGLVSSPMARRAEQDESVMRYVRSKQPLDGGRIGRPDDLVAAAIYFLSDASAFVTGQVLAVDGGWSVTDGQNEEHATGDS